MKTRRARKSDPEKMFQSSEAFLALCATLTTSVNLGNPNILELVMGTNAAFALESYLKCLRTIDLGEYLEGHDLKLLYDDLSEESRTEIERRHAKCEQALPIFGIMRKSGIHTDLRSLLESGRNAFQDFRYAYEEIPRDTVWGLDVLMLIVKHLILEKRPEWKHFQLDHTPSPHIARESK